ncbi:MAG: hypothetical protein Q9162_001919 [Coniocarpon cinnabarinum]
MDPPTASTEILTTLNAAQKATTGLANLTALQKTPKAHSALVKEVSRVQADLQHVSQFIEHLRDPAYDSFQLSTLRSHIRRAHQQLDRVSAFVDEKSAKAQQLGEERITRNAWRRERKRIYGFSKELRSMRRDINTAFTRQALDLSTFGSSRSGQPPDHFTQQAATIDAVADILERLPRLNDHIRASSKSRKTETFEDGVEKQ